MEVKINQKIRRVSVKELEEAYRSNKLLFLLKSLSDKELAEARTLVECDDIIGIRIDILLEIQREQSYRKVNVSNLENAYKNNKLDELVKLLSDEELNMASNSLLCDDIVGIRISILQAIELERMSRIQEQKKKNMQ